MIKWLSLHAFPFYIPKMIFLFFSLRILLRQKSNVGLGFGHSGPIVGYPIMVVNGHDMLGPK